MSSMAVVDLNSQCLVVRKGDSLEYLSNKSLFHDMSLVQACYSEDIGDAYIFSGLTLEGHNMLSRFCVTHGYSLLEVSCKPVILRVLL